jgi:hemolysin III
LPRIVAVSANEAIGVAVVSLIRCGKLSGPETVKRINSVDLRYQGYDETLHALSHAIGAVLSVIGLGLMLWRLPAGEPAALFAVLAFGLSLILLYSCSACYHASTDAKRKAFWRKLDHSAIYLLIAGTYTPFTLISLKDSWGFYLVLVVWGIACLGVALEFVAHLKFKRLSLMLYLLMGWLVLIAAGPMLDHVPAGGLWWLLAGGLCYSGGVIFYLWHRLRYHHLIWHCFVVAGSICHFWSVYRYVLSPQ